MNLEGCGWVLHSEFAMNWEIGFCSGGISTAASHHLSLRLLHMLKLPKLLSFSFYLGA